jgi:hypothetical protein
VFGFGEHVVLLDSFQLLDWIGCYGIARVLAGITWRDSCGAVVLPNLFSSLFFPAVASRCQQQIVVFRVNPVA